MSSVQGLPDSVGEAYDEARRCFSVGGYVGCELVCRKILMHVGADKGAGENLRFVEYVDHLAELGYVTPPMKEWVDLIRKHGNAATHELDPVDEKRAEGTLAFTMELLRMVYEMAAMTARYVPDDEEDEDSPSPE